MRKTECRPSLKNFLEELTQILGINQTVVAEKSNVSRAWLSGVFTGQRRMVNPALMLNVKRGLLELLDSYPGTDRDELRSRLDAEFLDFESAESEQATDLPETLGIAAELLTILTQKCPNKSQQQRVLEHLLLAVG